MSSQGPMISNDRELWREREGDYYANSIHVTDAGGIGINVGGYVIVKPLAGWHKLAAPNGPPQLLTDGADSPTNKGQDTPIPTPEGQGGEEDARELVEWCERQVQLRDYAEFMSDCVQRDRILHERNRYLQIARLLSSPRVEEVRRMREALEEARRYLDAVVANSGSGKRRENYAGAVRRIDAALSLQVG